jgi:hypothetical protein
MTPIHLVVASGSVGTTVQGCLASVLPFLNPPSLQQRGRRGRASSRVEELFQWLCALVMNPPQPVLASQPVGITVLGWLSSALPPERSLATTHLREHVSTAERTDGTIRGTPEPRESRWRPFVVVGGVGTTGRCYLVSVLPLRRGLLLEPPRGKTGGQRGAGKALPEAQPRFLRVNHVLAGLSGVGRGRLFGTGFRATSLRILRTYYTEPQNCCHSQRISVLQPMYFGLAIESIGAPGHGQQLLSSRHCGKALISVQF